MQSLFKISISLFIITYLFTSCGEATKKSCETDNLVTEESAADNLYVIETELGDITFEIYPEKVPVTVKNFLRYVENDNFEGATFYRVVRMDNQPKDSIRIEVIQGNFISNDLKFDPIIHETTNNTGVLHKDGAISMARLDPGSASAAFFICVNDQPELDFGGKRNPDGQGFAAFGLVTNGMDVVRKIQAGNTDGQTLQNPIVINTIKKVEM